MTDKFLKDMQDHLAKVYKYADDVDKKANDGNRDIPYLLFDPVVKAITQVENTVKMREAQSIMKEPIATMIQVAGHKQTYQIIKNTLKRKKT